MLQTIDWNVLILDKAQAIKNPAAQRTIAMKQLPRRVAVRSDQERLSRIDCATFGH